ncbi:hypothetical protein C8Q76DRAFT_33745 [Earliella scabrosa]|nr:hypothetical protein C8Q76DRAFT_33745 [Earliella scabrosa]
MMIGVAALLVWVGIGFSVAANAGSATHYQPTDALGACGRPKQNNDLVVALSPFEFAGGANCWRRMGVNYRGRIINVTIVDMCTGSSRGS